MTVATSLIPGLDEIVKHGDPKRRAEAALSSVSGECFQIWIDPPEEGQTCVYAACLVGRREDDLPETWRIAVTGLRVAIDSAFQTVTDWMAPSKRFFPPKI
jgi:hypothetical protein